MKKNKINKIKILVTILFVMFLTIYPAFEKSHAAALASVSDQMSRMKIGGTPDVYSNHTITFTTTTGVAAGQTIIITFPSDFAGQTGIDYTDVDMYAATERTLAAAPDTATWGAVFSDSGGTKNRLTLTSGTGTVVGGGTVVIEIGTNATEGVTGDKQMENATTSGSKLITLAAGPTDTGSVAVAIVNDDQIVYSATVDPSITASLNLNASSFGTITTSAVASAVTEIQVTINTNAPTGMTARVYDYGCDGTSAKPGLALSGCTGDVDTIGSVDASYADTLTTLTLGVEGYGINAQDGGVGSGGSLTMGTRYDSATDVGGLEVGAGAAQTLATAGAAISGRRIDINAKAAIDGLVKAGAYSDTVTIVVTGNF